MLYISSFSTWIFQLIYSQYNLLHDCLILLNIKNFNQHITTSEQFFLHIRNKHWKAEKNGGQMIVVIKIIINGPVSGKLRQSTTEPSQCDFLTYPWAWSSWCFDWRPHFKIALLLFILLRAWKLLKISVPYHITSV